MESKKIDPLLKESFELLVKEIKALNDLIEQFDREIDLYPSLDIFLKNIKFEFVKKRFEKRKALNKMKSLLIQ